MGTYDKKRLCWGNVCFDFRLYPFLNHNHWLMVSIFPSIVSKDYVFGSHPKALGKDECEHHKRHYRCFLVQDLQSVSC